ncbi:MULTISPECIES: RNA polymerase factor sigma-54 [unclassified Paludibacterium]|uniref:RNA polymerase factor sigma-54 n=1 Tax=unclassified Paludibacterium TaxID=2618429 RepID=UPI001C0546B2|nr:RNA polymerase factor sigma-54 [Paludibacterium sp. B53371]BEV73590.1 RNA polymerase factor sigma-54 [Paludibacterium sp. THUN1379]
MKQSLQLKVSQQLTLTPQLQQSIKLLQLSTVELQAEVERYLLENPLLERDEDTPGEPGLPERPMESSHSEEVPKQQEQDTASEPGMEALQDWGSGSGTGSGGSYDDEFDPFYNVPCHQTLRELLLSQLGEIDLPQRDHAVVQLLIEELDDDGYLTTPLAELVASLPEELALDEDELAVGLRMLQQFDPPGVGARSLPESLQLQLARLPASTPGKSLAGDIIAQHLALLGARDYTRLRKLLGTSDDALREAQTLIARLNPRPASGFDARDTHYVTPDVTVRKRKGRWVAELNSSAVPQLRVNQIYARMLSENRQQSGDLGSRLQEARWLVKNIQQRFDTILKVSEAIVDKQQAFFEQGEVAMRPMILRNIADELGLHESTVSRVTTQKYLLCPRGLFELKYFFGSALETDSGEECSATAIKAHIRRLIEQENPSRPLSDSAIAEQLSSQGIQVARRTVAKYREAMQIAPVNQRKAL